MTLQCRREHCPPKDLVKMLLQNLRKIGEFHNLQLPLLMERPAFDILKAQLKILKISGKDLPYPLRTVQKSIKDEVPHRTVFRFVSKILEPFVTKHFVGGDTRKLFLQSLRYFIGMRYGGSISTRLVCRDFIETSQDDGLITNALDHVTVYILLAGVAASVLHTHFRWCECKTEVPTVSYYFQDGWRKVTTKIISVLVSTPTLSPLDEKRFRTVSTEQSHFQPLLPKHVDPLNQPFVVTPSCARFVLKPNSQRFRLVINASCSRPRSISVTDDVTLSNATGISTVYRPISINQRLKFVNNLAEFSQRLRSELPAVYAPSTLSVSSAFDTLVSFRSAAYANGQTRFWLAKLDLLDCFHRIDHDRLLAVFLDVCSLAEEFMYPKPDGEHLKRELLWFLKNAIVMLDRKPFVFARGIPQGSCVSSDLTNLYLAHADRALQGPLNLWTPKRIDIAAKTLVLRYLDDYLCVASSSETLSDVMENLRENVKNYGMVFNETKVQTNIHRFDSTVSWLGMEIRNNLNILLPETPPPIFCRYAGQPLSADECLARLRRSRLQRVNWRYAFRPMPPAVQPLARLGRSSPVLALNACRLGMQLADLFWITVKTSPERVRLLQPTMAKRLAYIVRSKLSSILGPRQWRLQRLARNAFIQRLRSHRGELIHFFRALRGCPRLSTEMSGRLLLSPTRSTNCPLVGS